jgi:hypothetical protein
MHPSQRLRVLLVVRVWLPTHVRQGTMTYRKQSKATLIPCDPNRGNPNFTSIIAQNAWYLGMMPQGYRHGEEKRNEVFMMNVTPAEFAYLSTKKMRDFRRVRLGEQAFALHRKIDNFKPMFGTLSRSQRLAKRERKLNANTKNQSYAQA